MAAQGFAPQTWKALAGLVQEAAHCAPGGCPEGPEQPPEGSHPVPTVGTQGHIPVGLKIGVPFQVVVFEPKVSVLRDGLVKWGVRVLPGVPQHWALLWEGHCGQCC